MINLPCQQLIQKHSELVAQLVQSSAQLIKAAHQKANDLEQQEDNKAFIKQGYLITKQALAIDRIERLQLEIDKTIEK